MPLVYFCHIRDITSILQNKMDKYKHLQKFNIYSLLFGEIMAKTLCPQSSF